MEYFIVTADDAELLEYAVNERIKNGWVPQGGVSCSLSENQHVETLYAQAVVKKENK
ncbi:MAG: DUF1737 domain-containing protein [Gammaproteobacteria bacterium]|nr:DUF1737 domain-containing protein [Gammaproteobacteria bacterium]